MTFDSGPAFADRYTVFPYRRHRDPEVRRMYLACGDTPEHPQGFSQWGEGDPSRACGKRIRFADLPLNVRLHVARRMRE